MVGMVVRDEDSIQSAHLHAQITKIAAHGSCAHSRVNEDAGLGSTEEIAISAAS